MVSRDYLLKKPAPPSASRVFIDQQIVPLAIRGATALEGGLEALAVGARAAPFASVAGALLLGAALGAAHGGRVRRRRV